MGEFYKTRMGAEFFNGRVPKLIREIERRNDILEGIDKHLSEICESLKKLTEKEVQHE